MDVLGRKRGLKFGMLAKQQISLESQKLGRVLNGNSVDFALVPVIVYWGLFNNCYIKREDPDFTFEDVVNFVEDNVGSPDLFTPVLNCLYESSVTATGNDAEPKDEEKKSMTSTKRKGGTN